jgi:FkbM family methyltransferase
MAHFDFLEIGTSDFEAECINADGNVRGISVEPIKHYLGKLPKKENVTYLNVAVSNTRGTLPIYYLPEEAIAKLGLPFWLKGTNSIEKPHPTVVKLLSNKILSGEILSLSEVLRIEEVGVVTLMDIFNDLNISSLGLLKIDTEGHDCVILQSFFKSEEFRRCKPQRIIYESNSLSPKLDQQAVNLEAQKHGYTVTVLDEENTELSL